MFDVMRGNMNIAEKGHHVVMEGHRSFHAIVGVMEKHFPHMVTVKMDHPWDAMPWCEENIGTYARTIQSTKKGDERLIIDTTALWCRSNQVYGFKDPAHATAFKMIYG